MMEVVVTTGAIRRAKLQSNHHQQTNSQLFTFRSSNQQCQSTEGKHKAKKMANNERHMALQTLASSDLS